MRNLKTIAFLLVLFSAFTVSAQKKTEKTTPPSDVSSGYTYNFEKAKARILDRLTNPNVSNEDAQMLISQSTFPQLGKDMKMDKTYHEKLNLWIEQNPNLIINAFKNRTDIVQQF